MGVLRPLPCQAQVSFGGPHLKARAIPTTTMKWPRRHSRIVWGKQRPYSKQGLTCAEGRVLTQLQHLRSHCRRSFQLNERTCRSCGTYHSQHAHESDEPNLIRSGGCRGPPADHQASSIDQMAADLERQIRTEEERTRVRDPSNSSYSTFALSVARRRDNLR